MSGVPLMTLRPPAGDAPDSDQGSDLDEDPLGGLLTGMNYRKQRDAHSPWTGLLLAGAVCFALGLAAGSAALLAMGGASKTASPASSPAAVGTVEDASLRRHLAQLKAEGPLGSEGSQARARLMQRFFREHGFDTVSPIASTERMLTYFADDLYNKVEIINVHNGEVAFTSSGMLRQSCGAAPVAGLPVAARITGSVAYINYGRGSDYEFLFSQRVFVRGKIAVARLGKVLPVSLVDGALSRGARAVVLFPDPALPAKRECPLSPAQLARLQAAHGNATLPSDGTSDTSLFQEVASGLPPVTTELSVVDIGNGCVPVQLISAGDAEYLFSIWWDELVETVPKSWRPHFAPGVAGPRLVPRRPPASSQRDLQLVVKVRMRNTRHAAVDVMATMLGTHEPDRYVAVGNDREPAETGSAEPLAGAAAFMEAARVFAALRADTGWRPRRSLVFCSWGAAPTPERGRILEPRAVAYVGVQSAALGNGTFVAQATPLLWSTLAQAAAQVADPGAGGASGISVLDTWRRAAPDGTTGEPRIELIEGEGDLRTTILSLGIPSLDFHFTVSGQQEVIAAHVASAQLGVALASALASAPLLPLDPARYARELLRSHEQLRRVHRTVIEQFALPLDNVTAALQDFVAAAHSLQQRMDSVDRTNDLEMRILNDALFRLERSFLQHGPGLDKTDPVFRHVALSPGAYAESRGAAFGPLRDRLDDLAACAAADCPPRADALAALATVARRLADAAGVARDPLLLWPHGAGKP